MASRACLGISWASTRVHGAASVKSDSIDRDSVIGTGRALGLLRSVPPRWGEHDSEVPRGFVEVYRSAASRSRRLRRSGRIVRGYGTHGYAHARRVHDAA